MLYCEVKYNPDMFLTLFVKITWFRELLKECYERYCVPSETDRFKLVPLMQFPVQLFINRFL